MPFSAARIPEEKQSGRRSTEALAGRAPLIEEGRGPSSTSGVLAGTAYRPLPA